MERKSIKKRKDHYIIIRVTKDEKDAVKQEAQDENKTVSKLIRQRILSSIIL